MDAAAELIAEVGWGRVTTRAVAERADLPHGAVSYHFRGKQQLLVEAALYAFEQSLPMVEFEALETADDLIDLIAAAIGDRDSIDPRLATLMMETMREAERDPVLRSRLGEMLNAYRHLMIRIVRDDQERGATFAGAPPGAIATLLAAAGDGLLMHALFDPDLDIAAGIEALRAMLRTDRK
jgi:AcrR family transcriptional regulator